MLLSGVRRHGYLAMLALGVVGFGTYLAVARVEGSQAGDRIWLWLTSLLVLATAAALAIFRPVALSGWSLIVVGLGLVVVGDLSWQAVGPLSQTDLQTGSAISGVLYLAAYLALATGAVVIARRLGPGGDRSAALDAAIVCTSAGLAAWVLLVDPEIRVEQPLAEQVLVVGSPLVGLVLLAAAARLGFSAEAGRNPSLRLLVTALVATVASDAAHHYQSARGTWASGTAWEAGWFALFVCVAAAATHASVAAPGSSGPPRPRFRTDRFVLLLALVAVVPPALVLGQAADPSPVQAVVVVIGCGILFVLSLLRLRDLGLQLQETLRREELLREVNAALAAAPDRAGVRHTAVAAVAEMLPGCRAWWVETSPTTHGHGTVVAADPPAPSMQLGQVMVEYLARSAATGVVIRGPGPLFLGLEIPVGQGVLAFDITHHDRTVGYLVVAFAQAPDLDVHAGLAALAAATSLAHARVDLGQALADRQSERRLRRMTQHASDIIAVLDLDLDVRYLTPAVERLIGTPTAFLVGRSWLDLVLPADREAARNLITQARSERPSRGEVRLVSDDGSHRYVELFAARVVEDDEPGFVLTCHDITERRALEQQLTHQAFHDSLTGLANRALFRDRLEHALPRSSRSGTPFAVLFVDLDDFKNVNDTLGHAAGDALLRQVTRRLLDSVRDQDTVARLGGDEFALLLEDLESEQEAIQVAERFLEAMGHPFDLAGTQVSSGVSIGIAVSTPDTSIADEAMRNADLALYEAKNLGKNRYALFIPVMHELAVDRMQLSSDLRRGIADGELAVHFQPIVDLVTGRTAGVEALVRWHHPDRGLMGPGQFIPLAEETGLVVPLGRTVLHQALGTVARWQRRLPAFSDLYVTVNLSARQLQQDSIVDDVRQALAASGVNPNTVILEITESVLLPDEGVTLERLQALDTLGVRLFIDDFGTGYSSLSYLQQLPVHGIKLARDFVATLSDVGGDHGVDGSSTGLVATIRALAETLGLQSVIAEGVETPEQREMLLALGYRLGQGFLMAGPAPAEVMQARLVDEATALPRAVGLGV